MDLRYSPEEEAFRTELRRWLTGVLPTLGPRPPAEDWSARRVYDTTWQRLLYDAGYAGIDWPTEGGGRGAGPVEQLVYLEELHRAHAPYVGVNFVGLLHAGPTIIAEGNAEQRARFLPPILRGEEVWCQGFSETGAGSDLASLRTKAVLDGDYYVVSGSKLWTSHAQVADFCELLVRTGSEDSRHSGITWLAMPMDSEGIEIHPLRTITGSSEFAELYLDEVHVPVANRVGDANDGWRVAMVTFSFERGTAFVGELLASMELMSRLRDAASSSGAWGDTELRRRFGRIVARLDALWALARRNVSQAARTGVLGVGGSVFKLSLSEVRQEIAQLGMDVAGPAGLAWDDLGSLISDQVRSGASHGASRGASHGASRAPMALSNAELVDIWVNGFSRTIAAGTSQIQRNIIAERILGMPKG